MAKTSRDAYRHIRAWQDFFSDVSRASEAAVQEFIERYHARQYLRQSLKRLIARGFLVNEKSGFSLTAAGKRFFKRRQVPRRVEPAKWDGKWRLVSFDVPVVENAARDQLRALLKEFDFYQLHKSVWVCPNSVVREMWEFVVHNKLNRFCKTMVVDVVEGDEELRNHFHL